MKPFLLALPFFVAAILSLALTPLAKWLAVRLGAADVHAVPLRPEWTGTVVPSKFQAALAAGRAVLFAGSPDSAPACWIKEHGLGFTLTPEPASIESAAIALLALANVPAPSSFFALAATRSTR